MIALSYVLCGLLHAVFRVLFVIAAFQFAEPGTKMPPIGVGSIFIWLLFWPIELFWFVCAMTVLGVRTVSARLTARRLGL